MIQSTKGRRVLLNDNHDANTLGPNPNRLLRQCRTNILCITADFHDLPHHPGHRRRTSHGKNIGHPKVISIITTLSPAKLGGKGQSSFAHHPHHLDPRHLRLDLLRQHILPSRSLQNLLNNQWKRSLR